MEYLAGEKLSDVIRRDGPLDIVRAVRLGIQIAEGLNAAHRAGIIHRDIKSDNIMIVDDDCREDVKIMDFGIARPRDTGTMNQLTRMGMIMGTPAYMAPEQAEGAEVSDKTDIYALGIVLYEMLSGSVPFRATTPGAVLIKQLQEMPVSLRKLRREVPADVERIVMKALQKQPHKRQEHMREMMQDLQKVQSTMIADGGSETLVDTLVVGRTVSKVSSLRGRPLWVALMGVILVAIGLGTSQVATSLWGNLEIKKSTTELGPGAEQAPLSTISENPLVPVSRSSARANADSKRAIEDHMKAAEAFSSSGEYAHALAELRKAKSIASEDEGVQAELTRTKNACLAEQRLGLTKGKCE
jgi:serine/threonine protein kinase